MKNLFLMTCMFLASLFGGELSSQGAAVTKKGKGDKSRQEWKCSLHSRCAFPCLKSDSCSLTFDLFAESSTPLTGTFQVNIYGPNGEVVGTQNINAGSITGGGNDFIIAIQPPVCAGQYVVQITNVNVMLNGLTQPFQSVTLTNSCNTQLINSNISPAVAINPLAIGSSLQVPFNVFSTFLPFKKCKTHCDCEKE